MDEPDSSTEQIIKTPTEVKSDATVSVIVILSIAILFIGYYFYSQYIGLENTIYVRLKKFYGSSLSQLSLGLVIVFLVSDVVNAFNNSIMFPIIRSSFPNEDVWTKGVDLPRGQIMYPGLFIQTVVSFIISIAIMFMIGECVNSINGWYNKNNKNNKNTENPNNMYLNFGYVLVIITFIALVSWNIKEIVDPTEEEVNIGFSSPRYNRL